MFHIVESCPDKTEWRLISTTLCGWRRCFVADHIANTLVWQFSTTRWITFQPVLWIIFQFHHGILEPPMKRNLCHCQCVQFKHSVFPRTITDWNSLPLAVRLSQSIPSFHWGLLSSAFSNRCWSSCRSGGNGWSAPIAGYFTEEPKNHMSFIAKVCKQYNKKQDTDGLACLSSHWASWEEGFTSYWSW